MTRLFPAAACCTLLLLSACSALQQPQDVNQSWALHSAQLAKLEHWTASGKVALRTPQQSESASLSWRQHGNSTQLRLSGPLGLNNTTIDSDGLQLEIRQGQEYSRWRLDDPALQDSNTLHLPMRGLHYWLKGVPAPQLAPASITLDEAGRLPRTIQQAGWTVEYLDFQQFEGFMLPTRLRLYRDETSARIILRQWGDFTAP